MAQIYTIPFTSPASERQVNRDPNHITFTYASGAAPRADNQTSLTPRGYEGRTEIMSASISEQRGSYEAPVAKTGSVYPSKQEAIQQPPREQLPPLSSIFGSSSVHQSRSAQSPYSDRNSPIFPAVSPLDSQHLATHSSRQYDGPGAYFQRQQNYPYSSGREQSERSGIQPPPRPSQASAISPRYDGRHSLPDSIRPRQDSSSGAWSPLNSRPEYLSRDTSSSFRAHSDHRAQPPSPLHRPDDSRPLYRDAQTPTTTHYPPTTASTLVEERTVKDALGPKIWTGTQFLPRFVRQAEVSGEGICYFYDDGTHCKTVIDGEVVNAHWGVTKAGKPRKRLAIACITCREKKIKCDPDYPRCVQCEKFGRICKFKNAPRGGQGSPDTPPADSDEILTRPGSSRTEAESFKLEKRENSHSVSPRLALRQTTPDSELHLPKRQRTSYGNFTPVASDASPRPSMHEPTAPSTPRPEPQLASRIDHNLLRDWQVNPFTTNPVVVGELLASFYKHAPETAYSIFPEEPFKNWLSSSSEKSLDDLMLIFTILAVGAVFSSKSEHKTLGMRYASISRYACENRHFSIQLVQSRLLLSIYFFAHNNPNDAWDFCGGAIRAASGLNMNLEIEKSGDAYLKTFPYGLNRAGYAECRRRTFWSCYLMDRFNAFCSGHLLSINSEDIFLRLPCDNTSFDMQKETQSPYFSPASTPMTNSWELGPMAYLVNLSTIWGDVMANAYRNSQRPSHMGSSHAFNSFYENTVQRLHNWKASLPPAFHFSPSSLALAAETGRLSMYVNMHSLYHHTAMKLNRYVQKAVLSHSAKEHYNTKARQHAEELLVMMDTFASRRLPNSNSTMGGFPMLDKCPSPILGYTIISAVDILSARFKREGIPNRLASFGGAQIVIGELALFWQGAKTQQALISQRAAEMAEMMRSGEGADVCEMRDPIEKNFDQEYDLFYA